MNRTAIFHKALGFSIVACLIGCASDSSRYVEVRDANTREPIVGQRIVFHQPRMMAFVDPERRTTEDGRAYWPASVDGDATLTFLNGKGERIAKGKLARSPGSDEWTRIYIDSTLVEYRVEEDEPVILDEVTERQRTLEILGNGTERHGRSE